MLSMVNELSPSWTIVLEGLALFKELTAIPFYPKTFDLSNNNHCSTCPTASHKGSRGLLLVGVWG